VNNAFRGLRGTLIFVIKVVLPMFLAWMLDFIVVIFWPKFSDSIDYFSVVIFAVFMTLVFVFFYLKVKRISIVSIFVFFTQVLIIDFLLAFRPGGSVLSLIQWAYSLGVFLCFVFALTFEILKIK
jgi:hypothetical protein